MLEADTENEEVVPRDSIDAKGATALGEKNAEKRLLSSSFPSLPMVSNGVPAISMSITNKKHNQTTKSLFIKIQTT